MGQRIAERATGKAERPQELRQLVVILDQAADGDAGGGLHAEAGEDLVGALDFAADRRQPAVLFVQRHVVRIDRHDDAAQAVIGEATHVLLGPERAVGANHRANAALGRVAHHGAKVFVRERFSANKKQVSDVVLDRDVDHVARLSQRDGTAVGRVEPVHREPAKIAAGVTDVGDGELQIAGAAVIQHFAQQAPNGFFRFDDRRLGLGGGEVRRLFRPDLIFGGLIVSNHGGESLRQLIPKSNPVGG